MRRIFPQHDRYNNILSMEVVSRTTNAALVTRASLVRQVRSVAAEEHHNSASCSLKHSGDLICSVPVM